MNCKKHCKLKSKILICLKSIRLSLIKKKQQEIMKNKQVLTLDKHKSNNLKLSHKQAKILIESMNSFKKLQAQMERKIKLCQKMQSHNKRKNI